MAKFTDKEFRDIMHSDNQLWAKASLGPLTPALCEELELPEGTTGVVKQIDTPALGGRRVWVYPEDNKGAFESFGPTVRAEIKAKEVERDEQAAIKRAQAEKRAADNEQTASDVPESGGREGGTAPEPGVLQAASQEAVPAYDEIAPAGTGIADRRDALRAEVERLRSLLKRYEKEERALTAALEIMNAPEDDDAEQESVPIETEGPE